jgi:hypothetical protein
MSAARSAVKRSGSNVSGSSQISGSRCVNVGFTETVVARHEVAEHLGVRVVRCRGRGINRAFVDTVRAGTSVVRVPVPGAFRYAWFEDRVLGTG